MTHFTAKKQLARFIGDGRDRGITAPAGTEVLDNQDKTGNLGAYYCFNSGPWHADGEIARGVLGRRSAAFGYTSAFATTCLNRTR